MDILKRVGSISYMAFCTLIFFFSSPCVSCKSYSSLCATDWYRKVGVANILCSNPCFLSLSKFKDQGSLVVET